MYLTQALHKAFRENPSGVATIFAQRSTTFSQLIDRVARLASALRGQGVAAGDRVDVAVHQAPAPQGLDVDGVEVAEALLGERLGRAQLARAERAHRAADRGEVTLDRGEAFSQRHDSVEAHALDAMAVRQAATLAAAPSYLRAHIVGLLQSPVVSVAMRADGLRGAIARIQGVAEHADA